MHQGSDRPPPAVCLFRFQLVEGIRLKRAGSPEGVGLIAFAYMLPARHVVLHDGKLAEPVCHLFELYGSAWALEGTGLARAWA